MHYQHKLRFRVFLSYPLLGLVISLFMIVYLLLAEEALKRQYMDSFLMQELNFFIDMSDTNPALVHQKSKNWEIYKIVDNSIPDNLEFIAEYQQGVHDIEHQGRMYELGVIKRDNVSYYILLDDMDFSLLENKLVIYLITSCFIILLLTVWYGLILSNKVLEPITSLAYEVKSINPEHTIHYLAHNYAHDEVGSLALEFDAFQERLYSLIKREREFTGNASHELRNPLAVILAASENLSLQKNLPLQLQKKVSRIRQSANEISAQLDVLLTLSRKLEQRAVDNNKTYLAPIIEQLVIDYHDLLATDVKLISHLDRSVCQSVPHAIIAILIGNLIKNALIFTNKGSINLTLNNNFFSITDTGCGIASEDIEHIFERGFQNPDSPGSGFGLNISKRICDNYGWKLQIQSQIHQGTQIKWIF